MKLWIFLVQTNRIALPVKIQVNAESEEKAIEVLQERILRVDGPPKVKSSRFTLIETDDFIVNPDKKYVTKDGRQVVGLTFNEKTRNFMGSVLQKGKQPLYTGWTVNGHPLPTYGDNMRLVEMEGT